MQENRKKTIRPVNPVDEVRKIMGDKGLTQIEFAKLLDVAPSGLNMFLKGERALTSAMMLKLGSITDITAEIWAKRARDFAEWQKNSRGESEVSGYSKAEGPGGLIPGIMVDTHIIAAIASNHLDIQPFKDSLLKPASYNLRIGQMGMQNDEIYTQEGSVVELAPGDCAIIMSLEKITISDMIIGKISIPNSLAMEFIFASNATQIDPGYSGHISAALENRGTKTVPLKLWDTIGFIIEFQALNFRPKRNLNGTRTSDSLSALGHQKN